MTQFLSMALAVLSLSACGSGQIAADIDTPPAIEQPAAEPDTFEESALKITVGDEEFLATWEDNASARAFYDLLSQQPLTVDMSDYGGFEKVGDLGAELTRSDTQITTQPGDIILYQGSQITIYYDVNTWNFTRLARIDDPTDLSERLGAGTITATFSLA